MQAVYFVACEWKGICTGSEISCELSQKSWSDSVNFWFSDKHAQENLLQNNNKYDKENLLYNFMGLLTCLNIYSLLTLTYCTFYFISHFSVFLRNIYLKFLYKTVPTFLLFSNFPLDRSLFQSDNVRCPTVISTYVEGTISERSNEKIIEERSKMLILDPKMSHLPN